MSTESGGYGCKPLTEAKTFVSEETCKIQISLLLTLTKHLSPLDHSPLANPEAARVFEVGGGVRGGERILDTRLLAIYIIGGFL